METTIKFNECRCWFRQEGQKGCNSPSNTFLVESEDDTDTSTSTDCSREDTDIADLAATTTRTTPLNVTHNRVEQDNFVSVVKGRPTDIASPCLRKEVRMICRRLANNDASLQTLSNFSQPPLSHVEAKEVFRALKNNTMAQSLSISLNGGSFPMIAWNTFYSLNLHLTELYLCGSSLCNYGCEILCQILCENTINIQILDLSRNSIGDKGADAFGRVFRYNTKLRIVILSSNRITASKELGSGLANNISVRDLSLSRNLLVDDCLVGIARGILDNHVLTSLDLSDNPKITGNGITYLAESLQGNDCLRALPLRRCDLASPKDASTLILQSRLESLDLSDNNLRGGGMSVFGNAIPYNHHLREMKLQRNKLGDLGAKAIGKGLLMNKTLRVLMLTHNGIQDEGAQKLAEGLLDSNIQKVWLDHNKIESTGAVALGRALRDGSCLIQELNLDCNMIGDEGAKAVAKVIAKPGSQVSAVCLRRNYIRSAGATAIANACASNTTIKVLGLGDNAIDVAGCVSLALSVAINKSLQTLWLSGNTLGRDRQRGRSSVEGMCEFGRALSVNMSLRELWLCSNSINASGLKALLERLPSNTTIESIHLENNAFTSLESVIPLLSRNHSILDYGFNNGTSSCLHQVDYLETRNKLRLRSIIQDTRSSGSIWPAILAALSAREQHGLDLCSDLLRNRPDILGRTRS